MSARPEALGGRPALPKRFYASADALEREGEFVLALDGKPALTPGRAPLAVPSRDLGMAIAAEWNGQVEVIDPTTMPLTRLANAAIDGVTKERAAVAADVAKYAGSDLVCYRAAHPDRLVARQSAAWDPVVAFARDDLGARLVLAEGVMFVAQSAEALEAVRCAVPDDDAFVLAGLHAVTTMTGSALLALGVLRGRFTAEEAWAAAHVDENWTNELWGADAEAEARRAGRWVEMQAAACMMTLARGA